MRISDIIDLGMRYLRLGLLVLVPAGIGFILWYFLYFRKKRPGERLEVGKVLLYCIFLVYLVVVFGATMLSRGSFYGNEKIYPLFYSYKSAWNNFSMTEWRNIILNILMFVPFGCMLPLLSKKMDKWYKVYLAGFLVTGVIEGVQLLLNRGVFEPDDLMGNTFGTMIGYGIYCIGKYPVNRKKKAECDSLKRVLLFQLPLVVVVAGFFAVFMTYRVKELGNLNSTYLIKQENIQVTSRVDFEADKESAMVYRASVLTVPETEKLAQELFGKLGCDIDEERTDVYENSVLYYTEGENRFSLWVDYDGGVYSLFDYEKGFDASVEKKMDATEEEIRRALDKIGAYVPTEAEFINKGEGQYRFLAETVLENGFVYDGFVEAVYYEDGSFGVVNYQLLKLEGYKEFSVMSERKAYEELMTGKFSYWRGNNDLLEITVTDVCIDYQLDTKGFYQPVYVFRATINDGGGEIAIPAIK